MHYLYKITNLLNNKVYIGQSRKPEYRWYQHKSHAKGNKSPQYLHFAMAKHGLENFTFEVIATCLTQDYANDVENLLIIQYDSRNKQYGYNIKPGGNTAPHAEETKQKQREATIKQIQEKGHPAQGTKRTPEQIQTLIRARHDNPVEYTPEIRQRMSESHIGKVLPPEQREKMAAGIQANWDKRNAERFATGEIKCNAPGCDIHGKSKYKIIDGIRYCNKHGLRQLRYGRLDRIKP